MTIGTHPSGHYEIDRRNCTDGEDEGMMVRGASGQFSIGCRQAEPNKVKMACIIYNNICMVEDSDIIVLLTP